MNKYMPYIMTLLCSAISGFASYMASRKKAKTDIEKIVKQHELDIDKEREKFAMEIEKMEIEHKHQLELKEKEMENQLGIDLVSTLAKDYIRSPEGQAQMRNLGNKRRKR